jgi:hypothetical protein
VAAALDNWSRYVAVVSYPLALSSIGMFRQSMPATAPHVDQDQRPGTAAGV